VLAAVYFCRRNLLLCSALQLSNDIQGSYFTVSGSRTVDNDRRTRLEDKRSRQETQLDVDLGEEGTISVGPRRRGDLADSHEDWRLALDVDPHGADDECVVELKACSSCWIRLTVIVNRFDQSQVVTAKDDQYLISGDGNGSKSSDVICQLWSVVFVALCCMLVEIRL